MRSVHATTWAIIVTLGCFVVLVFGTMGASYYVSHTTLSQQMRTELTQKTALLQRRITKELHLAQAKLTEMGQSQDIQRALTTQNHEKLHSIVRGHHHDPVLAMVDRLSIQDINGEFVGDSPAPHRPTLGAAQDYYVETGLMFDAWHLVQKKTADPSKFEWVSVTPIINSETRRLMGSLHAVIQLDDQVWFLAQLDQIGLSHLSLQVAENLISLSDEISANLDPMLFSDAALSSFQEQVYAALPSDWALFDGADLVLLPFMMAPALKTLDQHYMMMAVIALCAIALMVAFMAAFMRSLLKNQAAHQRETVHALVQGQEKIIELDVSPIQELQSSETFIHKTLDQLHRQDRFHRSLLNHVKIPVLIWDQKGLFTHMNLAACHLFGVEPEEICTLCVNDLLPEMTLPLATQQCVMHRSLKGEFIQGFETRCFHRKLDKYQDYVWKVTPIWQQDVPEVSCCMVQGQDVTRLKKLEKHPAKAEKDFEPLLAATIDFLWESDDTHRLVKISTPQNVFAQKTYRVFLDRFLGDLCGALSDTDCPVSRKVLEQKVPFSNHKISLVPSDGPARIFSLDAKPVFDEQSQEFQGYMGIARDVTAQVQTRQALAQMRRHSHHQNIANARFLGSISHELRTPLNSILGFSNLMGASTKETLSERQTDQVHHIQNAAHRLLNLIDGLLDLTKLQRIPDQLTVKPLSLTSLMTELKAHLMPLALAQQVTITMGSEVTEGFTVKADKDVLFQILIHLGRNAIQFNRPGGNVTFNAHHSEEGSSVIVSVEDDGIGIAQADLAHIFDPLARLETEGHHHEGLGLGLTMAQQLANVMDGHIKVDSSPQKGSRFMIELPAHCRVDGGAEVPLTAPKPIVLYVEDNQNARLLMEEAAHEFGKIDLITASSAEKGLDLMTQTKPELILMDIHLPGMTGVEMLQKIKRNVKFQDIPVIALSAHVQGDKIYQGLEKEFTDYLPKPFRLEKLYQAFNRYVCA